MATKRDKDKKSYLEDIFEHLLVSRDIPYAREVYVDDKRKWRYDFVIAPVLLPNNLSKFMLDNSVSQILVEIQGGIYMRKSGHNTPNGITNHAEKENWTSLLGHKIIKLTTIHFVERIDYIIDLLDTIEGKVDPDKLKMNYKKAAKKRAKKK